MLGTDDFRMRAMLSTDAEVVAKLCGELGYPTEVSAVQRRLEAIPPGDLLIVAVDGKDEPAAFIQATVTRAIEAEMRVLILALVVSLDARRSGLGRKLIEQAEHWARGLGAEAIVVRSNVARGEAHDFYPALGYRKVKTQAVYLKDLN